MVGAAGGVLVCLPGDWATSSGTRGELIEADDLGMPIFEAPAISDDPLVIRKARLVTRTGDATWEPVVPASSITLGQWIAGRAAA